MAVAKCNWPKNFNDAERILNGKNIKRIGHNTHLHRLFTGEIVARYHGNAIVSYMPCDYAVSNAGWNTVTTSGRIHDALLALGANIRCGIKNGIMYLEPYGGARENMPWNEWVEIGLDKPTPVQ